MSDIEPINRDGHRIRQVHVDGFMLIAVIDADHARYQQVGRVVMIAGDAERITVFTLEFNDGAREDFTPAQVRLVPSV